MPLSNKAILEIKEFNFGVSYRLDEKNTSFKDANNVSLNRGKLEKRYGIRPLSDANLSYTYSVSFFKKSDLSRYYIVRSGSSFSKVNIDGTSTLLKAGLTKTGRHNGVTFVDRHIIADPDGLFQYNGTTFTQLGQQQSSAVTLSLGAISGTLATAIYQAQVTYYSSATGFESAPSSASATYSHTTGNSLKVSGLPTSASNLTIDKIRIYLKKSTQTTYIFYAEVPLGTAEYTVTQDSFSSSSPPSNIESVPSGSCNFICEFNRKLVAVFEDDPNTVRASLQDDPDSFDSDFRITISGDGPITGIATGLYSESVLTPYLVVFKENRIGIYSEINGEPNFYELNSRIGCVSHYSIVVRNGDVYFMSKYGFYCLKNGRLLSMDGQPHSLGGNSIRDIFTEDGFIYELSQQLAKKSFSFYFQEKDQYITFVYEKLSGKTNKCYAYDFKTDSFLPWTFPVDITFAVSGEDSNGIECPVLLQNNELNDITKPNILFRFNNKNQYQDKYYPTDSTTSYDAISSYAIVNWMDGQDFDASYNYRECLIRVKRGQPDITLKAWVNFTYQNESSKDIEIPDPDNTFILDQSRLDIDALGEGRDIVTARVDINLAGESILLGFYQSENDANIILSSLQLEFSKNGNRNK